MSIDKLLIEIKNANIQILRNQLFILNRINGTVSEQVLLLVDDTKAILLRLLDEE